MHFPAFFWLTGYISLDYPLFFNYRTIADSVNICFYSADTNYWLLYQYISTLIKWMIDYCNLNLNSTAFQQTHLFQFLLHLFHTVWFQSDPVKSFYHAFPPWLSGIVHFQYVWSCPQLSIVEFLSHYQLIAAPCHENEWEKGKAVLICIKKSYWKHKGTWSIPSNGWHEQQAHNVLIYGSLHCWQGLDWRHVAKQRYLSTHGFDSCQTRLSHSTIWQLNWGIGLIEFQIGRWRLN